MASSKWMIACCLVAMVGFAGCSDDDDDGDPDTNGATAEVAVEGALTEVVEPLVTVMELVEEEVLGAAPAPSVAGIACPPEPEMDTWCDDGSASCVLGRSGLEFTFDSCAVSTDSEEVIISGRVNLNPPSEIEMVDLQIDGGPGLNGTMIISPECDTFWNITASNGTTVQGNIIQCDDDPNPQASSTLIITATVPGVGWMQVAFDFDGSGVAIAAVAIDGEPYAICDVVIDTYEADCEGV